MHSGGSIIGVYWVVTAGHCVVDATNARGRVFFSHFRHLTGLSIIINFDLIFKIMRLRVAQIIEILLHL